MDKKGLLQNEDIKLNQMMNKSEAKVLIFGGTSEGRKIFLHLTENKISCDICVATRYGKEMLPACENVIEGRLSSEEMRALIQKNAYSLVIDATHPYAVEVSKNIISAISAVENKNIRLFRLEREVAVKENGFEYFNNAEECASALKKEILNTDKNILLTTGSKDLPVFCSDDTIRERIFARVIPCIESLEICQKNSLEGRQIIAMQGPFSVQMNLTQIVDNKIGILVTKESGVTGGFDTKIEAASEAGIKCFVIKKPGESDQSAQESQKTLPGQYEVFHSLETLYERLKKEFNLTTEKPAVILAGLGMGSEGSMTVEVQTAIKNASHIFGAERILNAAKKLNPNAKAYPYYLSKDIVPVLQEEIASQNFSDLSFVILFSGDVGFYSGAEKLLGELKKIGDINIKIFPGISSMQYLFAKCGLSWQNTTVLNLHGVQKDDWTDKLSKIIYKNKQIFFISSSFSDIQELGTELLRLSSYGNLNFKIILGYQLSYPEEKIRTLSPKDCQTVFRPGLYSGIIIQDN